MKNFENLKKIVASVEADAEKFFKQHNKTAGTRVRKAMQELKNISQEIRKEVTAIKEKLK